MRWKKSILLMENAKKIFRDRRGRLLGIRMVIVRNERQRIQAQERRCQQN